MIASLLAFGAAPAQAIHLACPDSIPSAGFNDLAGLSEEAVQAIDCIADYDVTIGTTATTFSPYQDTERWQMALFLTRLYDIDNDLPSGADQGFTDLAGVPAAGVTAINQLAQLGITVGTSATTYSPFQDVLRWEMALFLTRLVDDLDDDPLPDGSDQGFTDIGDVPAAGQTAINQLKQLEISTGTTATTYAPYENVARWQMALFLARTMNYVGITPGPTAGAQVVITPTADATLSAGQAKAFKVDFFNTDGSVYTGLVGVQVHDVNATDVIIYNDTADNVDIETVDGVAVGAPTFSGFPGVDGSITVVIRHDAGATEEVRVLAYLDSNADGDPEVTGATTAPTEPFAVSGLVTFDVPPAEAADGSYTTFAVTGAGTNSFTASKAAVDCGNGAGLACTFNYDDNDIYLASGAISTQASFAAALTTGDTVTITGYDDSQPGSANVSFNLVTDTDPTSTLKVTAPAATTSVDAPTFSIQGTGQAAATVKVYTDANDNGAIDGTDAVVAQATVAAGGSWAVNVSLAQNQANNFQATQTISAVESASINVPTINEGAPAAATIAATTAATNGGTAGILDPGDVIVLDFSEDIGDPATGDTITLIDVDGSTATITCGTEATCADTDDDTITVTITNLIFASGGGTAGIQSPAQIQAFTGFTGADGLDVNVGGSGIGRVIGNGAPVGDAF